MLFLIVENVIMYRRKPWYFCICQTPHTRATYSCNMAYMNYGSIQFSTSEKCTNASAISILRIQIFFKTQLQEKLYCSAVVHPILIL